MNGPCGGSRAAEQHKRIVNLTKWAIEINPTKMSAMQPTAKKAGGECTAAIRGCTNEIDVAIRSRFSVNALQKKTPPHSLRLSLPSSHAPPPKTICLFVQRSIGRLNSRCWIARQPLFIVMSFKLFILPNPLFTVVCK